MSQLQPDYPKCKCGNPATYSLEKCWVEFSITPDKNGDADFHFEDLADSTDTPPEYYCDEC